LISNTNKMSDHIYRPRSREPSEPRFNYPELFILIFVVGLLLVTAVQRAAAYFM